MPPALIALAPVIAAGVSAVAKHKSQSAAFKKQDQYAKQQATAEEAANKAAFEAQQNSPGALARRQSFTLQLGKLLGAAGGKEKIPPSIYNYLQSQRQAQAYSPGSPYIAKPNAGGGIWDVVGGAGEALSYLDTSKLHGSAPKAPTLSQYSNVGSSDLGQASPESSYGSGLPGYQSGQVAQFQNQQTPLLAPLAEQKRPLWSGD